MNYINFKKYVNARLDMLKEDLVRRVDIPENTITYDGILGSYIINPFTDDEYSMEVVVNNSETLKELNDLIGNYEMNNVRVTDDGATNHYILDCFFNKSILDEVQAEFKKFLNSVN